MTDESISLYLDALLSNTNRQIPLEIFEHVAECSKCRKLIISIYEKIRCSDNPILEKEKWYNNLLKNKVKVIPINLPKQDNSKKKYSSIINF
ncbi:MAG: hypothetical protein J7J86_01555 [Bacteroidales bacterium]|nr:hypothetical protein [Bacteroidales bacterium]